MYFGQYYWIAAIPDCPVTDIDKSHLLQVNFSLWHVNSHKMILLACLLYLMLSGTHHAQNYAGIICWWSLILIYGQWVWLMMAKWWLSCAMTTELIASDQHNTWQELVGVMEHVLYTSMVHTGMVSYSV